MCSWTKDQVLSLMAYYQEYSHFYDKNHEHYLHHMLHMFAYDQIRNKMQTIRPGISFIEVREEIRTIRIAFYKEYSIRRTLTNPQPPSLWCYEQLKFLELEDQLQSNYLKSKADLFWEISSWLPENSITIRRTYDEFFEGDGNKAINLTIRNVLDRQSNMAARGIDLLSQRFYLGRMARKAVLKMPIDVFRKHRLKIIEVFRAMYRENLLLY